MKADRTGIFASRPTTRSTARHDRALPPPAYGIERIDRRAEPASFHPPGGQALPERLAAGIETLSGVSMRGVEVHYRSPEPSRLGALALARGSSIHLGGGSDQHLPHEAWHVAQQRQGRVQATHRLHGAAINHDAGLEREAELMGSKAARLSNREMVSAPPSSIRSPSSSTPVAQCRFVESKTLSGLIELQAAEQADPPEDVPFTTVGFEHEFAQMKTGPLLGLTHVEIAQSKLELPYTNLGFKLETDADDALELVSPPFLIETVDDKSPIPKPADVDHVDKVIKTDLAALVSPNPKLGALIAGFGKKGIDFELRAASVGVKSVTPSVDKDLAASAKDEAGHATVPTKALADIDVVPSRKGQQRLVTISSQVNIATDANTYGLIQALSAARADAIGKLFAAASSDLLDLLVTKLTGAVVAKNDYRFPVLDASMRMFLHEFARVLAGQIAIPSIEWMQATNTEVFKGEHASVQLRNRLASGKPQDVYELHRGLRSHVKDAGDAWLKDTLANFGLGLLSAEQWRAIQRMLTSTNFVGSLDGVYKATPKQGFKLHEKEVVTANLQAAAGHASAAMRQLLLAILAGGWQHSTHDPLKAKGHGPTKQPEFGSHDPRWFAARQDTFIPSSYVRKPTKFADRRLYVVEGRGDHETTLRELDAAHRIQTSKDNDTKIAADTGVPKARVTEIRQTLAGM
ncbi:hypothetical protein ACNOYE_38945 [Nannocystaceae bacterium ST9]